MQCGKGVDRTGSVIDWQGCQVFLLPKSGFDGLLGRVLNNIYGLLGIYKVFALSIRTRYDVIQVRDQYALGVAAWLAARLSGAKFTYWMSFPYAESKLYQSRNRLVTYPSLVWIKGQIIRVLLYDIVLPAADHVFVQSERMKEDLAREGIDPQKMTAIPMGVPTKLVGVSENARPPRVEDPLLLHLGAIQRLRRSEILVTVLYKVRKRFPGARLCYVGEGIQHSDRQTIVNDALRLGLADFVEITGFLPIEVAWAKVRNADICFSVLYPTSVIRQSSPTKLIEYMAMAKCIVANDLPEQCQVLTASRVGRCVPWGEAELTKEVFRLLDDPEGARAQAARGPDWVRAHRTYDIIADRVLSVYKTILS